MRVPRQSEPTACDKQPTGQHSRGLKKVSTENSHVRDPRYEKLSRVNSSHASETADREHPCGRSLFTELCTDQVEVRLVERQRKQ